MHYRCTLAVVKYWSVHQTGGEIATNEGISHQHPLTNYTTNTIYKRFAIDNFQAIQRDAIKNRRRYQGI